MVAWKLNMAHVYISDFEVPKLKVLIPILPNGNLEAKYGSCLYLRFRSPKSRPHFVFTCFSRFTVTYIGPATTCQQPPFLQTVSDLKFRKCPSNCPIWKTTHPQRTGIV